MIFFAAMIAVIRALIWVIETRPASTMDAGVIASTDQNLDRGVTEASFEQDARSSDRREFDETENSRPEPTLTDLASPIDTSAQEWLEKTLLQNPDAVRYDRHRLVRVNLFQILQPIKASPQFLSAANGEPYGGEEFPDFLFQPFKDRTYRLVIRRTIVHEVNGKFVIAVSGVSYDEKGQRGKWNLVVNEDASEILGEIDSVDEWISFWPGPNQEFHVMAELSQRSRAEQIHQMSDW